MKSGMKVVIDYDNTTTIINCVSNEVKNRFNCKILSKDGKEISAPKEYNGIDTKNDLIFVGEGIVTADGEYI